MTMISEEEFDSLSLPIHQILKQCLNIKEILGKILVTKVYSVFIMGTISECDIGIALTISACHIDQAGNVISAGFNIQPSLDFRAILIDEHLTPIIHPELYSIHVKKLVGNSTKNKIS